MSSHPSPARRLRPRPRHLAPLALAIAVVALAGCASRNQALNPFDGSEAGGTPGEEQIRIDVQNLNFNDVTIWAMRQGQRIRLGRVTGKTDETFRVGWNVAVPISFVIDVVGGRTCQTNQVGVDRGSLIWVSIPSEVGTQPCYAGRR